MTVALYAIPNTGAAPLSNAIKAASLFPAQVLGFGLIGGTYTSAASISNASAYSVSFVYVYLTNTTNEALWVSPAGLGVDPVDTWFVPALGSREINFMTNRRAVPITFLYVRSNGSPPTSGQLIFEGYL